MPNPRGSDSKSIVLHKELAEKLSTAYEVRLVEMSGNDARGYSFQRFVNEIIRDRLEKERLLRERFPHLYKIAIQNNTMYIKDRESDNEFDVFAVSFKNGKLHCKEDYGSDCQHVEYALAHPELAKIYRRKEASR
jgi:hypothetical protein